MAQKTDARIFRQNINKKNWQVKYNEKNNEESSFYLYKTLEIQKYLNRFFELYKIKTHNCKIFYCSNSLKIFISFYISNRTIYRSNKNLNKRFKNLKFKIKNTRRRKAKYLKPMAGFKQIQKEIVELTQTSSIVKFHEILLNSLAMYTNNKVDILVTLQHLSGNKQLSHAKTKHSKHFKIILKQLKRFVRNNFFKEAIGILFIAISTRKSAKLLADFLAEQFRFNQLKLDQVTISRKDNYFLGFLKQAITLLIKYDGSCLAGVKIVIKGRFNKAPRARTVSMCFGKFPLQSFSSKIDYYQSTAYTINGTFGIKI